MFNLGLLLVIFMVSYYNSLFTLFIKWPISSGILVTHADDWCLHFMKWSKTPVWFWMDQILKFMIYLVSNDISANRSKSTILDQEKTTPNIWKLTLDMNCPVFSGPLSQSTKRKESKLQCYLLAGDGVLHPLGGGWPCRPWRGGRESPPMTGGKSNG